MGKTKQKYIALLRGINVGGHHKVPMAELKEQLGKLNFENVVTLLNSGNVVFEAASSDPKVLEETISQHLAKTFGFPIPTIVRTSESIYKLLEKDPFKEVRVTKDIRLYVSFLRNEVELDLKLPWTSADASFRIIHISDTIVLSILDLSVSNTPKAMEFLERFYGKNNITTRNWNTIKRIEKKL